MSALLWISLPSCFVYWWFFCEISFISSYAFLKTFINSSNHFPCGLPCSLWHSFVHFFIHYTISTAVVKFLNYVFRPLAKQCIQRSIRVWVHWTFWRSHVCHHSQNTFIYDYVLFRQEWIYKRIIFIDWFIARTVRIPPTHALYHTKEYHILKWFSPSRFVVAHFLRPAATKARIGHRSTMARRERQKADNWFRNSRK